MSTLSIGVSGLNAANIGLSTTSHNIANVSTPGYNRQVIVQGTNIAVMSGAGFIGQGTNVQTVKRVYDQFLSQQVLSAQTNASAMDSYSQQIQQIDNLFADPESGLSPALSEFFRGVQEVAANPASIPARQSMLSTAETLTARFQSLGQRLEEIGDGVNAQISGEVGLINSYATQIADLNQRILLARAGGLNQEPNDLLDQRDQLIADLNKSVGVSTVAQSDGSLNVFFGNGQPLVVGEQTYTLVAQASASDPERIVVAMQAAAGNTVELPESQITGGKLGGLVAFRNQSLDQAKDALDTIAVTLAQDFNDQHRLGVDLDGTAGSDFFTVGGALDIKVALADPRAIAASSSGGAYDNRNAVALAALQTAKNMLGGTASYQSAYSQIVSAVGNKTREVQAIGAAQQGLADAAEIARQQVSGVNLDEEAANLLRYQQAYQASARIIEISGKLFDDLLAITG